MRGPVDHHARTNLAFEHHGELGFPSPIWVATFSIPPPLSKTI